MPGPGILDSLRIVREKENVEMEALIVAQMSSKGNLVLILLFQRFKSLFSNDKF